ncbi:MAG: hypothetical protein KC591_17055 [Gemmatimonadetes bacterium]|nr:hypothetical protein [Gemmatimonadota bacterium]
MKSLWIGAAIVLAGAGIASAHHVATADKIIAHHTATPGRIEAHHTVSDAAVVAPAGQAEAAAPERGPHDGALVKLGDDVAVLEFVADPDEGVLHMYVWDTERKGRKLIRQQNVFLLAKIYGEEVLVMLTPQDQPGDQARGEWTSHYAGGHKELRGHSEFDILVEGITIDNVSYWRIALPYPAGNGLDEGWPSMEEMKKREIENR